jgi:hypothetical protein
MPGGMCQRPLHASLVASKCLKRAVAAHRHPNKKELNIIALLNPKAVHEQNSFQLSMQILPMIGVLTVVVRLAQSV